MTDEPQTPGERALTPGDEPPPLHSGDQSTVVEAGVPDTVGQSTVVEAGVPDTVGQPTVVDAPPPAVQPPPPLPPVEPALSGAASVIQEKPEIAVGGAFAGGLLLAAILKRLAR